MLETMPAGCRGGCERSICNSSRAAIGEPAADRVSPEAAEKESARGGRGRAALGHRKNLSAALHRCAGIIILAVPLLCHFLSQMHEMPTPSNLECGRSRMSVMEWYWTAPINFCGLVSSRTHGCSFHHVNVI